MDLDPRLLRSFLTVAAERSFSRAAERLGCSQTTMSQRIKGLEDALSIALFNRDYHDVTLTPSGEALLAPARRVLQAHDALGAHVQRGRVTGAVRLGIAEDYVLPMLPRLMRLMQARLPGVELSVETGLSQRLLKAVEARGLDLAVVTLPQPLEGAQTLARPALHWVSAPGFQPASPWPLALFPEGCAFRAVALPALAAQPHRIALTSASGPVIHAAVAGGQAITVMAEGTIPPDLGAFDGPQLPPTTIQVVVRGAPSPAVEALRALVAEVW